MQAGYLSEVFVSFQGEGQFVGQRHLFVRLAGCHLRCTYCDTPDSLGRTADYTAWYADRPPRRSRNPVSAQELSSLVSPLFEAEGPIDGVAVTGGEPLLQARFLAEWLTGARLPVPVILETSGTQPSRLAEVIDQVDIVSMDVKLPSNTGERSFWEEHERFAHLALRKDLYVKILVDGGTEPAEFLRAVDLVAALPAPVPVFIQPITGAEGKIQLRTSDLHRLYAMARHRLREVRVVPQVHKFLEWR